MQTTYPVHERFHTWQGEGCHMGRMAFFIRLFGCPVKCPWCDSAGTWHPKYVPEHIQKMTVAAIVNEVLISQAPITVITGGEPAIHDLTELTITIRDATASHVNIETSGAFPLKGHFDWITVSPKKWKLPLKENVRRANEFKFIIEHPDDILFYFELIKEMGYDLSNGEEGIPIWLHPEWSQRNNENVLNAISQAVKMNRHVPFRAGWQLHKLYNVDSRDVRSRPLVPLGGNPEKGF